MTRAADSGVRLAEVIAALSIATDLGMGFPLEFALTSCILSMRLADSLGWGDEQLGEVYYQALLRYVGCNAETQMLASLFGDELALRAAFQTIDNGNQQQVLGLLMRYIRQANEGESPVHVLRMMAEGFTSIPRIVEQGFGGHCEVAQRLAERMGFGERVIYGLGQLYERWDGKGAPKRIRGEDVAPAVLLVTLAQDAIAFFRLGDVQAAVEVVRKRAGKAYEPQMADHFCQHATQLFKGLGDEPTWDTVLAIEPGVRKYLTEDEFEAACEAIADFVDIKLPFTLGHSRSVADLAAKVVAKLGLPESDVRLARRAGFIHDAGKVGISAGIWSKPGLLTDREWEKVRMHPYYTERIFARPASLAQLGTLASLHHERLDGSGYHRGVNGAMLSPAARVLTVANRYQALLEDRPHRPALPPEVVAETLRREVHIGRMDAEVVEAVLAVAGHAARTSRREFVSGLSEREIEVLRLVARGNSMKQIAERLHVSRKTVDNHIQHIYAKIGVTTRAGATLFAVENNLL